MLVIVEHWNVHLFLEGLLDYKTIGRLDVLEVYTTKTASECLDDVNELLRVLLVNDEVDRVDICELFEEDGFAFHDWLTSQRPDVTKSKDCSAVGNNSHHISFVGVFIRL